MSNFTVKDALAIVRPRAQAKHGSTFPGAAAMHDEARELWREEFASWKALEKLGLHAAAECAWARRTAAESLTLVFVAAL